MKKYKIPKTKQQIKYEEDNKKLFQVFSSLAITGALIYGGGKYIANQPTKIHAESLETKVEKVQDVNNIKEINQINYGLTEPNFTEPNSVDANSLEAVVDANSADINDIKVSGVNKLNTPKLVYSPQEFKDIQNILYAEAANQSSKGRKIIARTILNRVKDSKYPGNIHDVVFDKNAFSCIYDNENKNWKQATGQLKRNTYEEKVYQECKGDANDILNGERLGIPREDEIIAYHDISVKYADLVAKEKAIQEKYKEKGKKYNGYWMNLEPVYREGRLIYYAPKKELKNLKTNQHN